MTLDQILFGLFNPTAEGRGAALLPDPPRGGDFFGAADPQYRLPPYREGEIPRTSGLAEQNIKRSSMPLSLSKTGKNKLWSEWRDIYSEITQHYGAFPETVFGERKLDNLRIMFYKKQGMKFGEALNYLNEPTY